MKGRVSVGVASVLVLGQAVTSSDDHASTVASELAAVVATFEPAATTDGA